MRTALTVATFHGGEMSEVLAGPETPIDQQRAYIKQARQHRTHANLGRIELWESDRGVTLSVRFQPEAEPAEPVHEQEQQAAPPADPEPVAPAPVEATPAPAAESTAAPAAEPEPEEITDNAGFETSKPQPKAGKGKSK